MPDIDIVEFAETIDKVRGKWRTRITAEQRSRIVLLLEKLESRKNHVHRKTLQNLLMKEMLLSEEREVLSL